MVHEDKPGNWKVSWVELSDQIPAYDRLHRMRVSTEQTCPKSKSPQWFHKRLHAFSDLVLKVKQLYLNSLLLLQSRAWLGRLGMQACIGEGNGSPLQYSCLENPRDRGAWWAAVRHDWSDLAAAAALLLTRNSQRSAELQGKETHSLLSECNSKDYVLLFSRSVVSNSFLSPGLQHARLLYPSLFPGNSCPSDRCYFCRKPDPGAAPVQRLPFWTNRLCSLRGQRPLLLRWGSYRTEDASHPQPPTTPTPAWVTAPLSNFSLLRQQTAPPGRRGRSLRRKSGDPWPGLLGHHLWWRLGPGRCPRGVQAAGLWTSPQCHDVCSLWGRIRTHLAGRSELHRKGVSRVEVPFPGLGAARLQTQAGRGGHLLRCGLHTVRRQGEGWGPGRQEYESWGIDAERTREEGFLPWSLCFQQTWRLSAFTSFWSSWESGPLFSAVFPGRAISYGFHMKAGLSFTSLW